MKEVKHVFKNGDVTIETSGFGGDGCREATKALEQKLGKTVSDKDTDDMYQHHESVDIQAKN